MNQKKAPEISVYYNSACPVCNAGINAQKGKSTACAINWKDVHSNNELAQEIKIDLPTIRKYLHLRDHNGSLKIGINAFIILWRKSPSEQWKASLFSLPLITQLARVGYFIFANLLYGWNRMMRNW